MADWAKGEGEEDNDSQNTDLHSSSSKSGNEQSTDSVAKSTNKYDDKFNRGKTSDITKRYSDIIPPWRRDTKDTTPDNLSSSVGKSTNKISNILKSFETKNEDTSQAKPKKSFEFSTESGRSRAKWQSLEKQEYGNTSLSPSRFRGKVPDRSEGARGKHGSSEGKVSTGVLKYTIHACLIPIIHHDLIEV